MELMEVIMSGHENMQSECPFTSQGEELINVKFFRGRRDDIILAEEIKEQARSAVMQHRMQTATVSKQAPVSLHSVVDVKEFAQSL
jgi:RNA-binding protein YhbY